MNLRELVAASEGEDVLFLKLGEDAVRVTMNADGTPGVLEHALGETAQARMFLMDVCSRLVNGLLTNEERAQIARVAAQAVARGG
jgi:hypothetical protein